MKIPHIPKYGVTNTNDSKEIFANINTSEYSDNLEIFDPSKKKELGQYVLTIKRMIYKSKEYSQMIKFLKEEKGMGLCGIHHNITVSDGFGIEMHHSPFVMEDIVYTVLYKRLALLESLKMVEVANEIVKLHYEKAIGLYPLCELCHDYVHGDDNDLFIPIENLYGNPFLFFEKYKKYMSDELTTKFDTLSVMNKGYTIIKNNLPTQLMKQYIYIKSPSNNNHTSEDIISIKKLHSFLKEYGT